MADLVRELALTLGRPVMDKTGFTGEFDLNLNYTDDALMKSPVSTAPDDPGGNRFPTEPDLSLVFAAWTKGWNYEPAKGPVEVLVVDHAERPPRIKWGGRGAGQQSHPGDKGAAGSAQVSCRIRRRELRQGEQYMNVTAIRVHLRRALALLLTLAGIATTANLRAVLQPANERKAAPQFALKDSFGKTIELKNYHGKVVLLDFWATSLVYRVQDGDSLVSEFQKTYGTKGFVAVGVSMDEGGWRVLKPFLAETHVPYPILLGDGPTAHRFGIQSLPEHS